ncbi:hypothetical protein HaLaN_15749 [Haematococcus lacustris]|uniref:Uncharacterized protein n=1 Tax=Haematococcus lacustris TaxID=44745 RepID=A0A699ZHE9_HAELA|nr:hypothetical protein HaLaN_15749 [Haematococcus lacustris]
MVTRRTLLSRATSRVEHHAAAKGAQWLLGSYQATIPPMFSMTLSAWLCRYRGRSLLLNRVYYVPQDLYQTPLAHRVVRVEAEGVNNVLR